MNHRSLPAKTTPRWPPKPGPRPFARAMSVVRSYGRRFDTRNCMSGDTSKLKPTGGRPSASARDSGTERALSSVSGKPSASSSTGLSPCQVIAGSTTSTRPPGARERLPAPSGTRAARRAASRTRYTPVRAVFGTPTAEHRRLADSTPQRPAAAERRKGAAHAPGCPADRQDRSRAGPHRLERRAAARPPIVTPAPGCALAGVGGSLRGDDPATSARFSTVTANA